MSGNVGLLLVSSKEWDNGGVGQDGRYVRLTDAFTDQQLRLEQNLKHLLQDILQRMRTRQTRDSRLSYGENPESLSHLGFNRISYNTDAHTWRPVVTLQRLRFQIFPGNSSPTEKLVISPTEKPHGLVRWYSSSRETHLRATERHLPYGITQCYLPPDRVECAPP